MAKNFSWGWFTLLFITADKSSLDSITILGPSPVASEVGILGHISAQDLAPGDDN